MVREDEADIRDDVYALVYSLDGWGLDVHFPSADEVPESRAHDGRFRQCSYCVTMFRHAMVYELFDVFLCTDPT